MKLMKKLFLILLALALTLCVASCSNDEKKGEEAVETEKAAANQNVFEDENGSYEYQLNEEGKCEIVKYSPASVKVIDVKLPKSLDDRDVVGIAASAFKAENSIKSVTVPETYTYVGDYAFYDCDSLTSVTFEGSAVTTIGDSAFEGCNALESINVPASVSAVGSFAFKDCVALKSIDLSGVKTLGNGAFLKCAALKTVTVTENISKISKNAFLGCDSLEYVAEGGALYLGGSANKFAVLVSAENLDIEACKINDATTVIADQAFLDCIYLKSVTVGKDVTTLSAACFENCPELEFNESENGLYLGTAANPYAILMSVADQTKEDFTLNPDVKILCDKAFAHYATLKDILFDGTKEEWEAIAKVDFWNNGRTVRVVFADASIEPVIYN